MAHRRLTTAQAIVEFLKVQHSESDGRRERLIGGMFGIFGHGNVAGLGQALDECGEGMPFFQPKNEQAMVHTALGYTKAMNRRATLACSASIGPGSTNMLTGAATATTNRLPVLLLPSDTFAHRRPGNVLQELEHPTEYDATVNDAFRPLSRFFDRIARPEQIVASFPEAMRVLTDPAETGAVTVSLAQDVQGEAFDVPDSFLRERVWTIRRPTPDQTDIRNVAQIIADSDRPLIIAGGGVRYAEADAELVAFSKAFGIPVMETFAGKGVSQGTALALGGGGTTGTGAAAAIARSADCIIAVGSRLTDFTTASRSVFEQARRFVSINVNASDAHKLGAVPVVGDARLALEALHAALAERNYGTSRAYRDEVAGTIDAWWDTYRQSIQAQTDEKMGQGAIIGHVNRAAEAGDVVVAAAGTPPGEIMKAWDNANGSQCFIEFGFSCMGHEIPAGLGVALARRNEGHVYVVIGDGTYLMSPTEIVTAAQERAKFTTVVIVNSGYQCIRALQEATTGTDNFGNEFRRRTDNARSLDGAYIDVDYAANARSMGAEAFEAHTPDELDEALAAARTVEGPSVVVVHAKKRESSAGSGLWWDLGVAEASSLERTKQAYERFVEGRARQKTLV